MTIEEHIELTQRLALVFANAKADPELPPQYDSLDECADAAYFLELAQLAIEQGPDIQAARLGAFRRALAYCIAQVMNAGSASQQWMAKEWLAITDDQMRDILDGKTAILFDQKWPDA